ncbi:hypothetical protein ACLKA7_016218 [Drosophila subpalustris]
MEYLCILNAFEQNYYNRIKEIERLANATAVSQQPTSSGGTISVSVPASSSSSASVSGSASSSSAASSTASSPTALAKEAAVTAAVSSSRHFPASFAHAAALAATQQQLQQRLAAAGYQQGQAEFPAQSPLFYQQQHLQQQQQQQQQQHQLPGAAHQQAGTGSSQFQQNNSNMANSLLWQPWRDLQQAAAMHHQLIKQQQQQQQLHKETRLTSKELPTTKWRRERRQRAAAVEYQVHDAGSGDRDRERERERERTPDMDSPIDMSVTSSTVKHQRASPPPPYREPLAGALSHCYAASRPSVITQAPPKREQQEHPHSHSHTSREQENRSTESDSVCDIDEHFRRSLGPDYAALLKSPTPSSPTPSPQPQSQQQPQPQPVVGNGVPMQQISPLGYRQQPLAYQQHHSPLSLPLPLQLPLPLPLPLSKMGLPAVHSPTLHSAPMSPQHELPPPQEEPLSLSSSPVRAASASPPSPPTSGASQILDVPVTKRERALDTPHHTPPRYNTPPPAYGSVLASTPTPPTMPAIIRVKAEPGLAAASSTHTPPASPTSSTNISIFTKTEASVDDHFAKALGDTWKKLQGQGKE